MLATRQRRRALVVFFTDVIDARAARHSSRYAGRAAQRHVVVIVAIQNDALLAAARPTATGSLALFESAAAEELVREREEALARMRHAGITVLDVVADANGGGGRQSLSRDQGARSAVAVVSASPPRARSDARRCCVRLRATDALTNTAAQVRREQHSVAAETASLAESGQCGIGETKSLQRAGDDEQARGSAR